MVNIVVLKTVLHFRYAPVVRVSDPGTNDRPAYTGFWFYDELQFDISGRFALGMKVCHHTWQDDMTILCNGLWISFRPKRFVT